MRDHSVRRVDSDGAEAGAATLSTGAGRLDILIVEDHPDTVVLLHEILKEYPVTVRTASTFSEALAEMQKAPPAVAMVDYVLPDSNGLDLLRKIQADNPQTLVILMSAYSTIRLAVDAVKSGALDVLNKPFQFDQLEMVLERAFRVASMLAESSMRWYELTEHFHSPYLIGQSPPFLRAMSLASRVAPTEATVLITGESGTGKELFARAIHENSKRSHHPFFPLNCSAIPDALLESELFGYRKGAFTGADEDKAGILERSTGGTVFLDEITETSTAFHTKILRVLQNREYLPLGGTALKRCDIRFLVATNKPIESLVERGQFREDLYFRLNGFEINLPPLRERKEDIPVLADFFLKDVAKFHGTSTKPFSQEALRSLVNHQWRGNVRELRNRVEMACILSQGKQITPQDLFPKKLGSPSDAGELPFLFPENGIPLELLEEKILKTALNRADGNVSRAARLLGLSRATYRYRLKKCNIQP